MNITTFFIAFPLLSAPLIYLVGRLSRSEDPAHPAVSPARWCALGALALTWVPFGLAVANQGLNKTETLTLGAIALRLDGLSFLMIGLALLICTLVVLFSGSDMAAAFGQEKYYAVLLATVGALIGLVCAADLFNLWVWFEAMAIGSYVLVAFYRDQPNAIEASVKYLVQSATGSVLVLLGIALVLSQTGTLNLEVIRGVAGNSPALLAAGALLVIGFGVKAAFVPLHTWLPDAYAQAPSGASALLSAVITKAGLVALLRALAALSGVTLSWGVLLMGFGVLNVLVGNLLALRQTQLKRLLAYSSLSHLGYIFLGLGIGVYAGQQAGAAGGFFHLLTHGLMSGLAFLAVGALIYALRTGGEDAGALTIADLSGAARRYPLAALALSIGALGLGGLPPLAGFMSKWQIFVAGFATHDPLIEGLIVFAALNSVLSLAYYVPLVNAVYRVQPSAAVEAGQPQPLLMRAPLVLLGLAIVAIGVWPSLVSWLTEPAGTALLVAFGVR